MAKMESSGERKMILKIVCCMGRKINLKIDCCMERDLEMTMF